MSKQAPKQQIQPSFRPSRFNKTAQDDPSSNEIQMLNDLIKTAAADNSDQNQDPGPEERLLLLISASAEDAVNLIEHSPTQCPLLGDSLAPPSPPPEFVDIQRWTTIQHASTWEMSLLRELYRDYILGRNVREFGIVVYQPFSAQAHSFHLWRILIYFISRIPRLTRFALYAHATRPTNLNHTQEGTWQALWEQIFPHSLPHQSLTHLTMDLSFYSRYRMRQIDITLPRELPELQEFRFVAQSLRLFLARLEAIARAGQDRLAIYLHDSVDNLTPYPAISTCLRQLNFTAALWRQIGMYQELLADLLRSLTLQVDERMDLSPLTQLTALYELRLTITAPDAWFDPAAFLTTDTPCTSIRALTISLTGVEQASNRHRTVPDHPIRLNMAPLFPNMETLLLKLTSLSCIGCRRTWRWNSPIYPLDGLEAWEMNNDDNLRQCFVHTVELEPFEHFWQLRLCRAMYIEAPHQISNVICLVNFVEA